MKIYKRQNFKKLLILRLTFFIFGTICFFGFKYYSDNLGYFTAVILITLTIIVIKDLVVNPDSFLISKYFFFGLVKITWRFKNSDNLKISSTGPDFGQDGDIDFHDDTASGLGCIFSIFSIFLRSTITMKEIKIEKFNETYTIKKSVSILLDQYEFNLLKKFESEQISI